MSKNSLHWKKIRWTRKIFQHRLRAGEPRCLLTRLRSLRGQSLITNSLSDIISLLTVPQEVFLSKHLSYHAERPKYPVQPGVGIFSFPPDVKGACISKNLTAGWILPCLLVARLWRKFIFKWEKNFVLSKLVNLVETL